MTIFVLADPKIYRYLIDTLILRIIFYKRQGKIKTVAQFTGWCLSQGCLELQPDKVR